MARNSASVRDSLNVCLPSWVRSASCIGKPSHIWLSISIPNAGVRLDFVWEEGVACLLEILGEDVAV